MVEKRHRFRAREVKDLPGEDHVGIADLRVRRFQGGQADTEFLGNAA
jgi:hypothetical protein